MALPFAADTWKKQSDIPGIPLNGVYSGVVVGPLNACYDRTSGVIQSFSKQAHHFNGFASTAQASVDNGTSWVTTYDEGLANTVVFTGWSLPHPVGIGRIHFQARWVWVKAFLVADGSILTPGGVDLYYSENGTNYTFLQRLHSWPAINQIGGDGGAASMNVFPSLAPPILIPGSGPGGVDAYWMASSFSFDAGGAANRTTFKACTLWRSVDGGITWADVRNLEPSFGIQPVGQIFRSTTGRLFFTNGPALKYTDSVDLLTATFSDSVLPGTGGVGRIVPMFGGTLLSHRQGTLIAGGNAFISCDNGGSWNIGPIVIPQNQTGYLQKLGPSEALIVAPGFVDPATQTVAEYSDDGGETWQASAPWLSSFIGESPVMLELQRSGRPIAVTRAGGCYTSSGTARGTASVRTICPLANAGLAKARPLAVCGLPLTPVCKD